MKVNFSSGGCQKQPNWVKITKMLTCSSLSGKYFTAIEEKRIATYFTAIEEKRIATYFTALCNLKCIWA